MLRLFAIIIASLLLSPLAMAGPAAKTQSPNAALEEVRQSFTLDGKPIPPEIFRDMGDGDIADGISILVTVDLKAAIGSNRYYEDIGKSASRRKPTRMSPTAGKNPVIVLSDPHPTNCSLS